MPGSRGWTARDWGVLVSCLAGPLAVGFAAGRWTAESVGTWYAELAKPMFTPPAWVFAPVWTALYVGMGVAAFLVWRVGSDRGAVREAFVWFGVQLVANGLWSILFFGLRSPGLAFAEILVLLALIVVTLRRFLAQSGAAGALLLPYLGWVGFAALLNLSIWRLNA